MLVHRIATLLMSSVAVSSALGGVAASSIQPKEGIAILVNEDNSHIVIDVLDGVRKGVPSHGVYELKPGSHEIRARLSYRIGRTTWSSNSYIDYSFIGAPGAVLKVVCLEDREKKTWNMWVEDCFTSKVVSREIGDSSTSPGPPIDHVAESARIVAEAARTFSETRAKAEAGDLGSQYNLALLFEKGEGVSQDSVESMKWLLKAAMRGHIDAQYMLGMSYELGRGVTQDNAEAFIWFSLAAVDGDSSAIMFRDEDEKLFSPQALAEAKARLHKLEEEIRSKSVTP